MQIKLEWRKYTVDFTCAIKCRWDSGVLSRLKEMRLFPGAWIHYYAEIFFPTLCQSKTQHASGCISLHQGAVIRPTMHQHASSSSSSSNVVSIGICGGASGWSLLWVSKRGPSPGSQASRVLQCIVIYLGRQCRCRLNLWDGRQNLVLS